MSSRSGKFLLVVILLSSAAAVSLLNYSVLQNDEARTEAREVANSSIATTQQVRKWLESRLSSRQVAGNTESYAETTTGGKAPAPYQIGASQVFLGRYKIQERDGLIVSAELLPDQMDKGITVEDAAAFIQQHKAFLKIGQQLEPAAIKTAKTVNLPDGKAQFEVTVGSQKLILVRTQSNQLLLLQTL